MTPHPPNLQRIISINPASASVCPESFGTHTETLIFNKLLY